MQKIKTLSLKNFFCLLIASLLLLQACDDESEPKDTTAPEVSFTNITADMTVWNTVPISVNASDDKAIEKVDVFVGANLLTTLTESPFETTWDSNTVDDGTYIIKVVVTDESGNTAEAEISIKVLNTLVTINIPAHQLYQEEGYSERGFVFLSDDDGNVIASQEYQNGSTVALKSTDFNGERFFLSEVYLETYEDNDTQFQVRTFAAIERGKTWVLLTEFEEDDLYAGEAGLNFTNFADDTNYRGVANRDVVYPDITHTEATVRLIKSPGKLYVVRDNYMDEEGPLAYNIYSGIVVGENTIDLSQVTKPLTKVVATFPEGTMFAGVGLTGYPVANDYTEPYEVGYFGTGSGVLTLDVYYPGTDFAGYFIETFYETENVYYSRGTNATTFDLPGIENDIDFSFANGKLSYSATGNFDLVSTSFENQTEDSYWSLIFPEGTDKSIPVFDLPAELQSQTPPEFGTPAHYYVYDFEELDGYEDMKDFVRASSYSLDELYEDGKNYVDIRYQNPASGGRLKSSKPYRPFGRRERK